MCEREREREREGRRERDESRNQIKNISVKSDRENKIIIINLSDRICKKKRQRKEEDKKKTYLVGMVPRNRHLSRGDIPRVDRTDLVDTKVEEEVEVDEVEVEVVEVAEVVVVAVVAVVKVEDSSYLQVIPYLQFINGCCSVMLPSS